MHYLIGLRAASVKPALLAFKDHYNQGWLIQRHGYRTPAAVRADLLARAA